MRTLWSVAVFGLVPIPPADTPISDGHDLRTPSQDCDFSRRMFLCRPIVKRMATEQELAGIREELEALGAVDTKRTRWHLVQISGAWRRVRLSIY